MVVAEAGKSVPGASSTLSQPAAPAAPELPGIPPLVSLGDKRSMFYLVETGIPLGCFRVVS